MNRKDFVIDTLIKRKEDMYIQGKKGVAESYEKAIAQIKGLTSEDFEKYVESKELHTIPDIGLRTEKLILDILRYAPPDSPNFIEELKSKGMSSSRLRNVDELKEQLKMSKESVFVLEPTANIRDILTYLHVNKIRSEVDKSIDNLLVRIIR